MNGAIIKTLVPTALGHIYHHAVQCYPEECCGFVLADGTVHRATNIQNELHGRDPAVYRRDARSAYTFSVADMRLLDRSFATANPASVIYHSHPEVGACFSREDVARALFRGRPLLPVGHLVVDVRMTGVQGARLFEWLNGTFECTATFPRQEELR